MSSTTWNPSDIGSGVALSNGNLTAQTPASSDHGVRATVSVSSGKWYWEVHIDTLTGTNLAIGIANASWPLNASTVLGADANGLSIAFPGPNIYKGNIQVATGFSLATGDVVSFALDADAGSITLRKNGGSAVTVSGSNVPSGPWFAAVDAAAAAGATTYTANFGATSFAFTPPAGFNGFDSSLLSFTVPVSGGIQFGGTAPVSTNFTIFVPSGGIKFGGTAPSSSVSVQQYLITPSGGIEFGGSAPSDSLSVAVFVITPEGGIAFGGAALISESIPIVPVGGILFGGSAVVLERIPFMPTGGIQFGGVADVEIVALIPVSGGIQFGGSAPVAFVFVEIPQGGIAFGGTAPSGDYQAWFAPSGGIKFGGTAIAFALPAGAVVTPENPFNDDFPGWAVNLEGGAPSRYERLPANSFTRFAGRTIVANAAGIYALDAGDDAGQPIRAGIQVPQSDYGTDRNKRINDVFIGVRMAGRMRLTVDTHKGGSRAYYSITPVPGDMAANRVGLGKGLQGRYWSLRLENVDGDDFELESIAFTPELLKRSGK